MAESSHKVDLSVDMGGLEFANPVIVASGTFASGREYADFIDVTRLGAIVTKGISLLPWEGNASPRIAETPSGMLNSIGLQNPGVEVFCEKDLPWLDSLGIPVIVNVAGHSVCDYAEVVRRLEREEAVDAYEINISCPNVDAGGMTFGCDADSAAHVVGACRRQTDRPMIVKLTPNVTDVVAIARAVVDAGADALSLINTLLGMSIDIETFKPKLARGVGGLSGPAIRPIAVRMVWEVAKALPEVPVIGMGGIMGPDDALEHILAGASAVAVGTGNFVDPTTALRVLDGITEFCKRRKVSDFKDLVGAVDIG